MANSLVIVESPTKIKTISKILGKKFKVASSMGHLIDLPKSTLGVDIQNNFEPKLIVVRAKQKVLTKLKKEAENKKNIYVATDPDREGEAIGYNIVNYLGDGKNVYRVTFQEITKSAVLKAFEKPRSFDQKKIEAQTARRILDRIVGYMISPLLWKKVGSRLSAGRVQSVALRLIVEREREIQDFEPKEYWQIGVDLKKEGFEDILTAALEKIDNEKFELKKQEDANRIAEEIKGQNFVITDVSTRETKRNPLPPYITSTLQQDAFNKLGFNASRTMSVAQQLYEGIELGNHESTGLITYMRTDSVNISQEATEKVRRYIKDTYGDGYVTPEPNVYKSKKSAQEAHEAIRPAEVLIKPDDIKDYLEEDQYKLYDIIWRRFVGSQMPPAVYENKRIDIKAGRFSFGVSGSTLIYDGFLTLKLESGEEDNPFVDFSHYAKDDHLGLLEVKPTQHFTKAPPRYSDASLVKALEENGIGRPSTYASIIQTLVFRNYVTRENRYFKAMELGMVVCDMLVEYFPKIMDVGFTAQMEENLDQIEEGDLKSVKLLSEFYQPFKEELDYAMENIEKTQNFIDKHCPECGRQMVVKWGRRGKFLSCSGFPACKHAEPFLSGVKCPEENCDGELVKRKSHNGRSFYGCSRYPDCTYTTNKLPE